MLRLKIDRMKNVTDQLIHCFRRVPMTDKPRTSRCPGLSVADITNCATSPENGD